MHYSGYIDKFQYKIPYIDLFGGIVAFTAEIFEKINGYSNEYWGWGGEDDDLFRKGSSHDSCDMTLEMFFQARDGSEKRRQKELMMERGIKNVLRPDYKTYRYRMIHHSQERLNPKNPKRFLLLNHWQFHQAIDGLSVSFI